MSDAEIVSRSENLSERTNAELIVLHCSGIEAALAELLSRARPWDGLPDRDLILLARDGVTSAFGELVERHIASVLGLLRSLRNSDQDAWDFAQQACFKSWRVLPTFNSAKEFRPWLQTIATNIARDAGRRRRRLDSRTFSLSEGSSKEGVSPPDPPSPPRENEATRERARKETVRRSRLRDRAVEFLDRYTDPIRSANVRNAIDMYLDGCPKQEIDERCGYGKNSALRTMRKTLQTALGNPDALNEATRWVADARRLGIRGKGKRNHVRFLGLVDLNLLGHGDDNEDEH